MRTEPRSCARPSDAAIRGTRVVHLRSATNLRSADRGGQGRNGRRERRAYAQVGREGTGSSDEEGGALAAMGGPR